MAIKLRVLYGVDSRGKKTGFYWPMSDQKRSEILAVKGGAPAEFEAIYQGRPGQREGSIFLDSDFVYYMQPEGLEQGLKNPLVAQFIRKGYAVAQAWDTAYEETKHSAWTVCVTALLVPCNKWHCDEDPDVWGMCDAHFDVFILDVYRDKIQFGDLVMKIRSQFQLWGPETVIIEKKASGISAIQSLKNSGLPIHEVAAELGKKARAISGVGAGSAQGWMRRHRVYFPTYAAWLDKLKAEMKDFSGADDGISDQVDAIVHLLRYAIITGSRATMLPTDWSPERGTLIDAELAQAAGGLFSSTDNRAMFLTMLGELPSMGDDPFSGLCGRCEHYPPNRICKLHRQERAAIDSCMLFAERVQYSFQTPRPDEEQVQQ